MGVFEDILTKVEAIERQLLQKDCYIREVPDTWEEYVEFHRYMKMYERMSREQSIEYTKKYLGPRPARVVVQMIGEVEDSEE